MSWRDETWLPVSLSRRTSHGPVFLIVRLLPSRTPKPKPERVFRNPVIYAKELAHRMSEEGISQAELARRLGVSRARVSQWLRLLKLPEGVLREVEKSGDFWDRQVVTERRLRKCMPRFRQELSEGGPDSTFLPLRLLVESQSRRQ